MTKQTRLIQMLHQPQKRIALMGMSGVGKTHLSKKMPASQWFHYSIDYRIGSYHLKEAINDFLLALALEQPSLAPLIRQGAISVKSKLSIGNLAPLSVYLGMVGNEALGGRPVELFLERLEQHRLAEIAAIKDIPYFEHKASQLLKLPHFMIDLSGSFCELQDEKSWDLIGQRSLLIYIKASERAKNYLIERAITHPKPLYYQRDFLLPKITEYLTNNRLESTTEIDPADFTRWIFPQLIDHRLMLYEMLAERYGITIDAEALYHVADEAQFFKLIEETIYG